jgi:hypothetical protein
MIRTVHVILSEAKNPYPLRDTTRLGYGFFASLRMTCPASGMTKLWYNTNVRRKDKGIEATSFTRKPWREKAGENEYASHDELSPPTLLWLSPQMLSSCNVALLDV